MTNFITVNRRNLVAGRCSAPTSGCKKHPKHRQSPGVCSLCLRDKLSRLPGPDFNSRRRIAAASSCSSSSSSASYYSSSSASSCASPVMYRYGFTTSFLCSKMMNENDHHKETTTTTEKMKIGGGFLSKFIFPRSKTSNDRHTHHHRTNSLLV